MRKIEKEMIAAVKARRNWKSGNTEVRNDKLVTIVCINGNIIAGGFNRMLPDNETWKRWPNRTTASRLLALGFRFDKDLNRWN